MLREVAVGKVGVSDVVYALDLMRRKGLIRRVLKLADPDGTLLPGEYESVRTVPPYVWDRFDRQKYPSADLELVPCYRWETTAHVS